MIFRFGVRSILRRQRKIGDAVRDLVVDRPGEPVDLDRLGIAEGALYRTASPAASRRMASSIKSKSPGTEVNRSEYCGSTELPLAYFRSDTTPSRTSTTTGPALSGVHSHTRAIVNW